MAPVSTASLSTPSGPVEIPTIGFGVWQVPDAEVGPAVATALEAGYRHIDTARIYGNEAGVGRALAESDVPRDEVFVTTKVWNDDHGRDATRRAFDASMRRLGLDVLDLYLVHWPVPAQDRYVETWRALRELRDEGRVRAVGTCNFHAEHLQRLHDETGEWPSINQIELHPYLQQAPLRAYHAQHGIVTESWSPLASGKKVLDDPVVSGVAAAHGATPAQVVIAWHLALDLVVLPKSVTPSRIVENLAAADLTLTGEEVAELSTLERGFRTGPNPEEFNEA
ncbi:MAG TPA: aldo/keto reductase [Ornithinibacter sp.]|nr:aldo/keto reductase [Ornithinibacter sp.]